MQFLGICSFIEETILKGCPDGGGDGTYFLAAQSKDLTVTLKDMGAGVVLPVGIYNIFVLIRDGITCNNLLFDVVIPQVYDSNMADEIKKLDIELKGKATKLLKNKKWVALGDSLTEKNDTAKKNYTDLISEELGLNCVNMGVSGTGYWKKENIKQSFRLRALDIPSDCDIVTIFGSGNDMKNDNGEVPTDNMIGNAADSALDTWCGCVNATIDNVLSINPSVRLGIISPTPWSGTKPNFNNAMKKMSDKLEEICKIRSIPFLNLYYCSNLRPWDESQNNCFAEGDIATNTHPNDKGNLLYYGRIREFIKGL